MERIISLDPEARTIKVEGGVKFTQINEALKKDGSMCLSNLASISDITVAGAIATGTHGTGLKNKILASMIKEMKVMNS